VQMQQFRTREAAVRGDAAEEAAAIAAVRAGDTQSAVAAIINTLTAAGADPNAPGVGRHPETPLHWAASSDDVDAIDALVAAGADIEAPGAVIGDGTPLADATAFGQWNAARRLIEHGAQSTLWESAALGLTDRVIKHCNDNQPAAEDITASFWGACHGNQPDTAAYLLSLGADINWIGWDHLTPLDAAQREGATDLLDWLREHGANPATESR
jgi:ankyrin repeat protein